MHTRYVKNKQKIEKKKKIENLSLLNISIYTSYRHQSISHTKNITNMIQ